MKRTALTLLIAVLSSLPVAADTVTIEAERDATLIEDPGGALANGSGGSFFVGRTNQVDNGKRRGLVYFDLASAVPEHALIESVSLTLFMNSSNPDPRVIHLYRVLANWGEGPSSGSGGGGAPAQPGDTTWLHTFWDTDLWVHEGGQFVKRSSAELAVAGSGFYTWQGDLHMVQDVRLWKSAPDRNFGWIMIGDETAPQTAKNFASREDSAPARRPVLTVTYRLAPGQ